MLKSRGRLMSRTLNAALADQRIVVWAYHLALSVEQKLVVRRVDRLHACRLLRLQEGVKFGFGCLLALENPV